VKEVSISEFRAKCYGLLEQVRKTRKPIRVTRFGKPVAEIMPSSRKKRPANWLGRMAGTARIVGDIVGPTGSDDDWERLADEAVTGHAPLVMEHQRTEAANPSSREGTRQSRKSTMAFYAGEGARATHLYPLNYHRLHHHILVGLVLAAAWDTHNFFDYVLAFDDFAKNGVIAGKPTGWRHGDEEL